MRFPELASGKVWIRYPVVRPQDVQVEEQREQDAVQTQPAVHDAPAIAAVVPAAVEQVTAPVVQQEASEEVKPVVVETTHPEVIAAAVDEQPQVIAEADATVAEETAQQAEPAVESEPEAPVAENTEVNVVEPEALSTPVEAVPEVAKVEQPVIKTESQPVETAEIAAVSHNHATAPMTRAPAPGTSRKLRVIATGNVLPLFLKVKEQQVATQQRTMLLQVRLAHNR